MAAAATCVLLAGCAQSGLNSYKADTCKKSGAVATDYVFNGYTNYWSNVYQKQYRYGGLVRFNVIDAEKRIAQIRINMAQELGIPGLRMQEGFFDALSQSQADILDAPEEKDLAQAQGNVLAFIDKDSVLGAKLSRKDPLTCTPSIGEYQSKAAGFSYQDAFILRKGRKAIFAVIGTPEQNAKFKEILLTALDVTGKYDLKRGWFGCGTHYQSVTCEPGTPVDVIGRGMNEGNTWFVFSGLYDTHSNGFYTDLMTEIGSPVVTDLGVSPIFGCDDWDGFQDQLMFKPGAYQELQKRKHGYIFNYMSSDTVEPEVKPEDAFDGYFVNPGQAKQFNASDKPFVTTTGLISGGTVNSMVLFVEKGSEFNRKAMWDAIMSRRSIAIDGGSLIIGSDAFRQTAQLLVLDGAYLGKCFGDKINLTSFVEGTRFHVLIQNLEDKPVAGNFGITLPEQIGISQNVPGYVSLKAGECQEIVLDLNPAPAAMGRLNAVMATFSWDGSTKSTVASFNMPLAVSTHQLLYGSASGTDFPVSVFNITDDENVPVKISVSDASGNEVFTDSRTETISKGTNKSMAFALSLPAGSYNVAAEAMGITATTQLGIGGDAGTVQLSRVDVNGDGVDEYVMENNKVRVMLLTTGARIIEYTVKSKDSNVFFKLWPDNPNDVNRPYRERGFWPFGGFEDFLGQASVETHKVYDAEVVKDGGEYAEVKMTADYYGNRIEKVFTLYGDTPLVGIRFALDMVNPEMNILGPQPILELGRSHGLEDKFVIPERTGLSEYRMDPVNMYGKILDLAEGWNAGQDTRENISFVGAYPVNRPYYLHMWMNLDKNGESHYPYAEFQPWLPLYTNGTSYFSYYMWADAADYNKGLSELRNRNLITSR